MLKFQDQNETVDAETVRVNPQELVEALRTVEERKEAEASAQEDTIPLGQALQALVTSELASLVDTQEGRSSRFQSAFSPCSWRADMRLIGLRGNSVGILSQQGKVEKVFLPETFTGAE